MFRESLAKNRLSSELLGASCFSAVRPELGRIMPLWLVCGVFVLFGAGAARQFTLQDLVVLFIYGYLLCGVSLLLVGRGDGSYSRLFLVSIIVRLGLIVLLEAFPPGSPPSAMRYVPGVVFEDETYYLDTARWLGQSLETLQAADWANPFERVAAYFALAHLLAGAETLWGRLLSALIGGLTTVAIYDLVRRVVDARIQRWVWWFTVLSPVLVIWSAFYLKEGLLVLGVALTLNATIRIHFGRFDVASMFMMIAGVVICLWIRNVTVAPLFAPLVLSFFLPKDKAWSKSLAFLPVSVCLLLLFVAMAVSPLEFAEWASLVGGRGLSVVYTSIELQQRGLHMPFPFFDVVMSWSGALRVIGFSFLLMLSPVVTSLWSLLPIVGRPSWYAFGVAAYAASWWICLPFWIRSAYDAVRQRDTWWLALAGGFILWSMVAAYARFGSGYDAFRWRDAMMPVIMLLAAKGLETTLFEWKRGGTWPALLKGYWVVVAALILLRGLGIVRLT